MVYIDNNTTNIKLPKYFQSNGTYTLRFHNNLSNKDVNVELPDLSDSEMYYIFNLSTILHAFSTAEYNLSILQENVEYGRYLMRFGNYERNNTTYDNNNKQKIVYYE